MLRAIPNRVDAISAVIAEKTKPFIETWLGKVFLSIIFLGPLAFLPTIYQAWTANDITTLKTITWPSMIVVNLSSLLSAIHTGDWRMRLVMFLWVTAVALVSLALLIR